MLQFNCNSYDWFYKSAVVISNSVFHWPSGDSLSSFVVHKGQLQNCLLCPFWEVVPFEIYYLDVGLFALSVNTRFISYSFPEKIYPTARMSFFRIFSSNVFHYASSGSIQPSMSSFSVILLSVDSSKTVSPSSVYLDSKHCVRYLLSMVLSVVLLSFLLFFLTNQMGSLVKSQKLESDWVHKEVTLALRVKRA